jgi:exopolysaccharide production protein ExoQ
VTASGGNARRGGIPARICYYYSARPGAWARLGEPELKLGDCVRRQGIPRVSLSNLPTRYSAVAVNANTEDASKITSVRFLVWFLCFLSFAGGQFGVLSQTLAASVFLAAGALPALILPKRTVRALLGDWLPWLYVALAITSITWSEAPYFTTRFGIELALTVAVALTMASAVEPHLFLSAFMCAYLVGGVAGLFVGKFALNAGAMAMIGIYGSKNAFSAMQAYLFLASFWVLLSARQSIWMRSLALMSVLVCPVLLVAGRSTDAIAPLMLVVPITFLLFLTSHWAPLPRVLVILTGILLIVLIFGVAFIFRDTLFGHLLIVTGKDVTLSGRTYLWIRAAELISQNPLLGTGYGAFWIEGNPYAEDIWAFGGITGATRGGINFHNLWYDMGVSLGYVGLAVAFLTVLIVNIRAIWWTVRNPSSESFFFLGFVWILNMRSFLESEFFVHFSVSMILFVVASYYARTEERSPHKSGVTLPRTFIQRRLESGIKAHPKS